MVGRRRRIIWGIKAHCFKRQRLRLGVYGTWQISATFQFLCLSFCRYQKGKSTKRLTKWLSKPSDHCNGACAEGSCRPSLASVPMWIQLPEMLRESTQHHCHSQTWVSSYKAQPEAWPASPMWVTALRTTSTLGRALNLQCQIKTKSTWCDRDLV